MPRKDNKKDGALIAAPTNADLKDQLEILLNRNNLSFQKGWGFIPVKVKVAQNAVAIIKYPCLVLKQLGLKDTDTAITSIVGAFPSDDLKMFTPLSPEELKKAATANEEFTNRLPGEREGRIIGHKVSFLFPQRIARTKKSKEATSPDPKKVRLISTRVPGYVNLVGIGLLQYSLNQLQSDAQKRIKHLYGPSQKIKWRVPTEAAEVKEQEKELAKAGNK